MSQQPPQYPPANPPPGGGPPQGGWTSPPGGQPPGGQPPGGWGPAGPGGPGGPPRRNNTPLIILAVVVAVAVVGGGVFLLTQGGGRSEEEEAYIDALAESSERSQGGDAPIELSGEEHRCLATAAVDTVGVERLQEIGTPEEIRQDDSGEPLNDIDLNLEEAGTYYDSANGCVDFREIFMADIEEAGLSQDQIDCVDRAINDQILRDLLVAEFAEDEDAQDEANDAADEATEECDLPG
jgi:hypothetical protein